MADYTLHLPDDYEVALTALTETWQRTQPETAWTNALVLDRMVMSTMETTLRELDSNVAQLVSALLKVPEDVHAVILNAVTGSTKARLTQLLEASRPKDPKDPIDPQEGDTGGAHSQIVG